MGVNFMAAALQRGAGRSSHNAGARKSRIENGFTPLSAAISRSGRRERRDEQHRTGRQAGRRAACGLEADRESASAPRAPRAARRVSTRWWSPVCGSRPSDTGAPPPSGSAHSSCALPGGRSCTLCDVQAELLVVAEHLDAPVDSLRIGLDQRLLRGRELRQLSPEPAHARSTPISAKNSSEAAMPSQRMAGRRCERAQLELVFDAAPHGGGGVTAFEPRFEAREPFFPGLHECPHLRRQQPALEAPARAVAQCAEYVFRREAVQQFAVGASSCRLPLGRQTFLEREQSAADPALHAAERIRGEARDFIVRAALDERERQALARVVVELADAVVEVVRLLEAAGARPATRRRSRRARRPKPGSCARGA